MLIKMAHLRLVCEPSSHCSRLLLVVLLVPCFALIVSATNDTDRDALIAFKAELRDPFGSLNSWNESTDFCRWYGVTCGRRHHRVTMLKLSSQGLSGPISPHIGNLSFLRILELDNNSLALEIPPQIGRLLRLQFLSLYNNSLTGEIPSNISSCINLLYLFLEVNQLVGGIPAELSSLLYLQYVGVSGNQLTGSIPSSIGNLSSLQSIYCALNGLSGVIPQSLGRLTKLETLALALNGLSGTIPPSIFNLSSLITIDVGENQIGGNLPEDIGFSLPNLQELSLPANHFVGSIPLSISNATNLQILQLQSNEFSGKVPSLANLRNIQWVTLFKNHLGSGRSDADDLRFICSLANATKLEELLVDYNGLGGKLPVCIGNLSTTIESLSFDSNFILGEIPREIGNLVNLQELGLADNLFSGLIPQDLGNLLNLGILHLTRNNLSGVIPSSLQNLQSLVYLYVAVNNLEGPIPSYLGKYWRLEDLDLSSNRFSGPVIFPTAGSLLSLDLSRNHLSGILPMEIGNLKHLNSLDVSGNILHGEIPHSLGNCDGITKLKLQNNLFHGSIPQSINSLRSIEEVDLSNNSFYGEIPKFFEVFLFLKKLNLSYNDLEGPLPTQGVFGNASAVFVAGNERLCGGMPEFELPKCVSQNSKSKGVYKLKFTIAIVFGLLGTLLFVIFLYLLCWLKQKRNQPISSSFNDSMLNLSYGALLKATDGFSSTNLIGVGSFGSVYKGLLQESGNFIAVKVLNLMRNSALKSFKAECEALKCIKHRNLLKVLTMCSGIDHKGDDFKAIIYEFMVNGNLEEWLRPNPASHEADGHSKKLSLIQRVNISIDIASALEYLHNQCENPIIHCDLKPSNVLLDVDMVGHVGDFGLAKIALESTSNSRADFSSVGLRGTIGYVAPEYASGSPVSREGDVYSYGILLLEMFTGVSPTSDMFKDNLNLHNYVADALPQQIVEITDPVLLRERESHHCYQDALQERNRIFQGCLETIYRIGLACTVEEPRGRLSIDKVATQLHSIKAKLIAASLLG